MTKKTWYIQKETVETCEKLDEKEVFDHYPNAVARYQEFPKTTNRSKAAFRVVLCRDGGIILDADYVL